MSAPLLCNYVQLVICNIKKGTVQNLPIILHNKCYILLVK